MAILRSPESPRGLATRKGFIPFPTYIPVTTFGAKYPLDDLVRPYLPRLAPAVMVSYHYAKQQTTPLRTPMLVDSGGFASLFERARVVETDGLGAIEIDTDDGVDRIDPREVIGFQERAADVAFTLDFPSPPSMDRAEADRRLELTIRNALWAVQNRRRRDLPMYGVVQGLDINDYVHCADAYRAAAFDGIAIGGLVPRARDEDLIFAVVSAVRRIHPSIPLHVFGLGKPAIVDKLFAAGVDSVDSSAYVKLAADGKIWGHESTPARELAPMERMQFAILNLAIATRTTLPLSAHGLLGAALPTLAHSRR